METGLQSSVLTSTRTRRPLSGVYAISYPLRLKDLLKNRVRIINVWRPLKGPVQCTALAFADSKAVSDEALISVEHRYLDRTGETLPVKDVDEQWYYCSGLENDERILLLEYFDSENGGRVPHTAGGSGRA